MFWVLACCLLGGAATQADTMRLREGGGSGYVHAVF
ncbi:unnamed protein product, partial [marine sediment metagenome]